MRHARLGSSLLAVALLTAAATTAQERAAPVVAINGEPIPPAAQPRTVVDEQQGVSTTARIRLTGTVGVEFARTIRTGDVVDISVRADDGASISIFSGEVVSLEPVFDAFQPEVVVHASSTVVPTDGTGPLPVTITHDGAGETVRLVAFLAALSATWSLQEVIVVGTDAITGAPLAGSAVAPTIALDETSAERFGTTLTINTDQRFSSVDEANAFALRTLSERTASRISAEVLTDGVVDIKVGRLVELEGAGTSFDGSYVVTAVQHRLGPDGYGGYSTALRVRRVDLGMFRIPDIDDEVLVSFDAGDTSSPSIVRSWWDCDSMSRTEQSDDSTHCRLLRWPW